MPETALICRVPEAERYIAHYRQRFDPSARRNVPAHVTILYPFMAPELVDAGVLATLQAIADTVPCFNYRMAETRRFPVALYLAPSPDNSFAALTDGVFRAFPDFPPFDGKFETPAALHHARTAMAEYMTRIGRRYLVVPLYEALAKTPEGLAFARGVYAKAKPGYHPMTQVSIEKTLAPKKKREKRL